MASPDTPALTPPRTSAPGRIYKPGIVLAFICVAQFMVFLDVTVVNVALAHIQKSLDMAETDLQYIVTAYGTVLGGFLLLGGRLADVVGRRRMLQIGLFLFAASSLVAGISQSPGVLIGARGFQGLGSALIAPAALSILTSTFKEGPERTRALGIWGALTGLASVAGVLLGGILTQGPGWRWIFFINVPIGIIAVLLAPLLAPESKDTTRRHRIDLTGAILLTTGLLLLIYTLNETVNRGWGDGRTIGGLAGAAVLLAAFLVVEGRTKEPLMPLGIFRNTAMRTANLATVLLFGSTVTLFFFASLFMQVVLGYSALKTGLAYVPLALVVAIAAGIASTITTKVAAKPVMLTGMFLSAAGLIMLARLPKDGSYLTHVLPAFIVAGAGLGASFVTLQVAAFIGVRQHEAGLAAGLINTSQEGGGALGVAVVATAAFAKIKDLRDAAAGNADRIKDAQASGFHEAFVIGAGFAITALVLALVLLPMMRASERPDTVIG
ncbi:DHA2 family efflux MFS transporter permease subunit [Actinomadura rayongensis]